MSLKKFALGAVGFAVASFFANQAIANNFVAGKDYQVVQNPQKVEVADKIEVREFFWYGCPHCHHLEPHMQTWLKQLPKDVRFIRTPAPINPVWEVGARAYFTSEALGVRQYSHLPLFDAHHTTGQKGALSQKALAKFFTQYNIPEDKFNSTFTSFSISNRVAQAKQLMQDYQLNGVPAVVVNGKYIVQGSDEKVPQVINYLIDKERKKSSK